MTDPDLLHLLEAMPEQHSRYARLMMDIGPAERRAMRKRAKWRKFEGNDKLPWHTIIGTRTKQPEPVNVLDETFDDDN